MAEGAINSTVQAKEKKQEDVFTLKMIGDGPDLTQKPKKEQVK